MIETVEEFNAKYPVGTAVFYWRGKREGVEPRTSRTRTPAWLIGHKPCVSVEHNAGGISLTHIEVIE